MKLNDLMENYHINLGEERKQNFLSTLERLNLYSPFGALTMDMIEAAVLSSISNFGSAPTLMLDPRAFNALKKQSK